jgi:hypothetical protein
MEPIKALTQHLAAKIGKYFYIETYQSSVTCAAG